MPNSTEQKEFDRYASDDYEKLLKDPIKNAFGSELDFFLQVKADLLKGLLKGESLSTTSRLLDLGCGSGKFTNMVSQNFSQSIGSDISLEMMKEKHHKKLCVADGVDLPFASESFDCVTAVCIFHHILPEQRDAVMREIHRLLKPGGLFFMFEHNPINPMTRWIVKRSPVDANAVLLYPNEGRSRLKHFKNVGLKYFLFYPEKLHKLLGVERKRFRLASLGRAICCLWKKIVKNSVLCAYKFGNVLMAMQLVEKTVASIGDKYDKHHV